MVGYDALYCVESVYFMSLSLVLHSVETEISFDLLVGSSLCLLCLCQKIYVLCQEVDAI